jgi:hypothetical protein
MEGVWRHEKVLGNGNFFGYSTGIPVSYRRLWSTPGTIHVCPFSAGSTYSGSFATPISSGSTTDKDEMCR